MELLQCFFLTLLCALFRAVVIGAQDIQSGFISIDCGTPDDTNYNDEKISGIQYISDASLIETGHIDSIAPQYKYTSLDRQLQNVRSFPDGSRNCYILRPAKGKSNKYLIRARFYHGGYDDGKNKRPIFDIHLGVDYWDTVNITDSSRIFDKEIIHIASSDIIHVCLVNKGLGTPFISALELRPLDDAMYKYSTLSESLVLFTRLDLGSSGKTIRYGDDIYDRIWLPNPIPDTQKVISTTFTVNTSSIFKPPSAVMNTAVTPFGSSTRLGFSWIAEKFDDEFYFYFYFAELEDPEVGQLREFDVYVNEEKFLASSVVPKYLTARSFYTASPASNRSIHIVFLDKTETSTLPPIVNAVEIYKVRKLLLSQTDEKDFAAIIGIKSMYRVTKNWQGDPCGPKSYEWSGLNCSYEGFNPPRIISVNLSSSGLTGSISSSISNLTMLQTLDLSNNKLTGPVPEFLAELESLKILNLKSNNFTGPIPAKLLERTQEGLALSIDALGNDANACKNPPCKKKNQVIVPAIASIAAIIVLLTSLAVLWITRRKKQASKVRKVDSRSNNEDDVLELTNKRFTYSDIQNITNNFQKIIGRGGFGTVYHGYIDKIEVAVKILNPSSSQGFKEFQAEVKVLINVSHKNLTSMVGYCIEDTNIAIIYEYMANGDLQSHLTDKNQRNVLSWRERLQIAIDAALGLEYLHHGCKRSIIHRDIKCTNILIDDKFQAKLADFGLSRAFPTNGGTHLSTVVAGTPGYLDPEYYISTRLTEKSDIYSFGIVLLEIFTSRPAIKIEPDPVHVIHWVNTILKEGDVKEIVDSRLMGDFDVNSAWNAIKIAMACVSRDSTNRPTMNHVVIELKESLAMEMTRGESETMDTIGCMSPDSESPLMR